MEDITNTSSKESVFFHYKLSVLNDLVVYDGIEVD